jgi:prephenate dehydrogenase
MLTRVAIVGCGLIGGSFAKALRAANRARAIVGFDRDNATARRAESLGIVDRAETSLANAVAGADLVLLAIPVAQAPEALLQIASSLGPRAIVTDVGSTKRDVIGAARSAFGAAIARFVPGHPIAGREVHGPDAAQADLFRDKRVLLTPLPENDEATIAVVRDAWTACGARVETIAADAHDAVLSAVSHLPHLLAFALVAQIAESSDAALKFGLAGSGFRDFTRIAASSPEMWRDIALANREALLKDLDAYRERLEQLRGWIADGNASAIEAMLVEASEARKRWQPGS